MKRSALSPRPPRILLLPVAICVLPLSFTVSTQELPEARSSDNISASDVAAANQMVQVLGIADWLGPLAPVALSPFFGIACLSGMALFGRGWVSADNAFLEESSPLNSPYVFWTFLILTALTSIPRFTKVSKPVAQAVDQGEAWAGIITLLALRLIMSGTQPEPPDLAIVQAGFGSVTVDMLLMVAAVINIFVINAIKFFFEVLIWITPVPAIDAAFELANKSVCAVLMAIYGYSPTLATMINLIMFAVAAIAFRWVYRRQVFFRTIIVDAVRQFVAPPKRLPAELTVFPETEFGGIPARAKCRLARTNDGWSVVWRGLVGGQVVVSVSADDNGLVLDAGYLTNVFRLTGQHRATLSMSRLHNAHLSQLAHTFGARLKDQDAAVPTNRDRLKAELV